MRFESYLKNWKKLVSVKKIKFIKIYKNARQHADPFKTLLCNSFQQNETKTAQPFLKQPWSPTGDGKQ